MKKIRIKPRYEGRHACASPKAAGPEKSRRRSYRALIAVCAVLVLAAAFTVGGTLAYMMEESAPVTNSFESGNITYTLNLHANATYVNHQDSEVEMPSALTTQSGLDLSCTFTPDDKPELTGYIFSGWYYDKNCANPYPAENIADNGAITVDYRDLHDGDPAPNKVKIELYARWVPITYTVEYHGNNNTGGSMGGIAHTYDVEQALEKNAFTRTGYTFLGWSTAANGTSIDYSDEQSVKNLTSTQGDVIQLYALWQANTYTIVYHANDAAATGTMADQSIVFDTPAKLSKNTFAKDDYKFMGWALASAGEVKYEDEAAITLTELSNISTDNKLHLYAVWQQLSHTVSFNANGGTVDPGSKQVYYGKTYGYGDNMPLPTRAVETINGTDANGKPTVSYKTYLFEGWYTEKDGGTLVMDSAIVDRKDDHVLYAHWKEAPTNHIISNITAYNVPDYNKDGVVDEITVDITCSSNIEKYNIPLTGLQEGATYTLSFKTYNNARMGQIESGYKDTFYGCMISETQIFSAGREFLEQSQNQKGLISTWMKCGEVGSSEWNKGDQKIREERTISIDFVAAKPVMYWVWDYGLIYDNIQYTFYYENITLTKKSAAKNLALTPEETHNIELIYSGIDDSNMDIWYPVDEQYPTAGDSYELAFEASEGCTMAEIITVKIDDVSYAVYTDGTEHRELAEGETQLPPMPVYDPENNILTIPAELLTAETKTVEIIASAVKPAEEPGDTTEKPGDTTEKPGDTTEKPGDTTEKPGDTTENPGDTTENPGDTTENPGDTTENPGATTENPGDTTEKPGGTTENPGESAEKLGDSTEEPGEPAEKDEEAEA